jgi:hypothetical protein
MLQSAVSTRSQTVGDERLVVLVLPTALGELTDLEPLRRTLVDPSTAIRVLLFLPDGVGHSLATTLPQLSVETEILLGPDIEAPETTAFSVRMLPGTSPTDQIDLAFAFSDVVMVGAASAQTPFAHAAKKLGKPIVAPGEALPAIPPLASATHRLDPGQPGWHSGGRRWFGRVEQVLTEILAFNWRGRKQGGFAESRKRIRRCIGGPWLPGAYFAPPNWAELAPDRAALDGSEIAACFDRLDRSALYGSYVHRDLVWIEHLGAGLAVLLAVAGHIWPGEGWGIGELVTLAVVALLVMGARHASLQDRWTACRFGAEQLRIARMSLPLLVLPPALATEDTPPTLAGHGSKESMFGFIALAQVKRAVRNHGLSRVDPAFSPVQAAHWLQLIVADQIAYHRNNFHKLEHAERRLSRCTQGIFLIAMLAVVAHFWFEEAKWLLLLTAAAPAFAAALHGTGTRLGIVHRSALSADAERELVPIDQALGAMIGKPLALLDAWREVRRLTFEAAAAMGRENNSWHGLVRRYRDELP